MTAPRWVQTDKRPMPNGESVLCWDAITRVMFVGYRSGNDVIAEPHTIHGPTPFCADWWRPLPTPPVLDAQK